MDKLMTEMSPKEFNPVIEKYIERESQDTSELPAPVFFQALRDIFSGQPNEETIELYAEVVDSQLQLYLPAVEPREYVMAHDNEIIVDKLRFVIHLV